MAQHGGQPPDRTTRSACRRGDPGSSSTQRRLRWQAARILVVLAALLLAVAVLPGADAEQMEMQGSDGGGGGSTTTSSSCSVDVTVTEPDEGDRLSGVTKVGWQVSGDDGSADVWWRQDLGSWNLIATGLTTNSVNWDTVVNSNGDGQDYQIKVHEDGGICEDTDRSGRFIVDNNVLEMELAVLDPTWNEVHGDTLTVDWDVWGDSALDSPEYQVWYRTGSGSWTTIAGDLSTDLTKELTATQVDWDTTAVPDADDYQIRVRGETDGDLKSAQNKSGRFSVDNTKPSSYDITNPAEGEVEGGWIDVDWTGTEANKLNASFRISTDGGATWTDLGNISDDGSGALDTADVDTDSAVLNLTPYDAAGNVGPWTIRNFTIDNTKPSVNVTGPTGGTVSGDVPVSWNVTEDHRDLAGIRVLGDDGHVVVNGTTDDGSYTWDSTTVPDGDYQLEVNASDLAGNNGTDLGGTFAVDNVVPDPTVTAPADGAVVGGSDVDVSWDLASNDISGVDLEYSVDGGSTWSTIATGLDNDGVYTWDASGVADSTSCRIRISATDGSGSTGTNTSDAFTCDNTDPTVDVSGPDGVVDGTATADWTTTDDHVHLADLAVSCDGASWTTVASGVTDDGTHGWDTTRVEDGTCRLRVTAIDEAGNRASATSPEFVVDNEGPAIDVHDPADGASVPVNLVTAVDGEIADPGVALDEARVQLRMTPTGPYWDAAEQRWQLAETWTSVTKGRWSVPVEPDRLTVPGSYEIAVEATSEQGRTATRTTTFEVEKAQEVTCAECGAATPAVELAPPTVTTREATRVDLTWTIDSPDTVHEVRLDHRRPGGTWRPIVVFPHVGTTYTWTPKTTLTARQQVRVTVVDVQGQKDRSVSSTFDLTKGRDGSEGSEELCTDGTYHSIVTPKEYGDGNISVMADCLGVGLDFTLDLSDGIDTTDSPTTVLSETPNIDLWIRRGPGEGPCRGETPFPGQTLLSLQIKVAVAGHELSNDDINATNLTATVDPPSGVEALVLGGKPELYVAHCNDNGNWDRVRGRTGDANGSRPGGDHVQVSGGFDSFSRYVVGSSHDDGGSTNDEPAAAFDAQCDDLHCTFDAGASSDDGGIDAYEWQLGDGTTARGETVEHTFDTAGDHDVTLTVVDDAGARDTATQTLHVVPPQNQGPTARMTVDCKKLDCTFDAAGSRDPDGSIAAYEWRFGDGTTAEGATVQRTFDSEGTRTVTLVVVDDAGATGTSSSPVTVETPAAQPASQGGGSEEGDDEGPTTEDAAPLEDEDAAPRRDPAERVEAPKLPPAMVAGALLVCAAAVALLHLRRSRRRRRGSSGGIVVPVRGRIQRGTEPSLKDRK